MEPKPCRICGNLFTPKQARSTLCGRKACEHKAYAGPPCVECGKPSRARGLCSTHYNQRHQPDRHRKITVKCARCGAECLKDATRGNRYGNLFCSLNCRTAFQLTDPAQAARRRAAGQANIKAAQAALGSLRARAARKLRKAARGTRGSGVLVAGACARPNCGEYFVRRYLGVYQPSPFCSSRCRRTERARQHDISDETRFRIFERDGWRCRIEGCGKPIDRDARMPHPLSPTIDHILPQSAGGGHEDANLRAAHFRCNSARRDRGTVQLLLIG